MKEQEAMEIIMQVAYDGEFPINSNEAFGIACKCIEKQIPRELTSIRKVKQYDGYDMGYCPVCDEPLDNSFYENLKYCVVCGQAIKWE